MNMRKHKRLKLVQMARVVEYQYWQKEIDKAMELTPEEKEASYTLHRERWDKLWADVAAQIVA